MPSWVFRTTGIIASSSSSAIALPALVVIEVAMIFVSIIDRDSKKLDVYWTLISFLSFGCSGLRLSVMLSIPSSSLASISSVVSTSSGTGISR